MNRFQLKYPAKAKPGEVNYSLFDRFTIVHILIGASYYYLGIDFITMMFLAIFWEIIENPVKAYLPFIFPHGSMDTLANAIGDILGVWTGWTLVYLLVLLTKI